MEASHGYSILFLTQRSTSLMACIPFVIIYLLQFHLDIYSKRHESFQ